MPKSPRPSSAKTTSTKSSNATEQPTSKAAAEPLVIQAWLNSIPGEKETDALILSEKDGLRETVFPTLVSTVARHYVNWDAIAKLGGYDGALSVLKNRLPSGKKIRSGDLGEILGTEYANQLTGFTIHIRRLIYKDDRKVAMRGDDVVGVRKSGKSYVVLKVEAKSRAALQSSVVKEADDALNAGNGRPNPSTLAFIVNVLVQEKRDVEAKIYMHLQSKEWNGEFEHLLFTVSGNKPATVLAAGKSDKFKRSLVGLHIGDHQAFIQRIYAELDGGKLA